MDFPTFCIVLLDRKRSHPALKIREDGLWGTWHLVFASSQFTLPAATVRRRGRPSLTWLSDTVYIDSRYTEALESSALVAPASKYMRRGRLECALE